MKLRTLLATLVLSILLAGLSWSQGPLTNALNLMVRTDANGSLLVYGVAAGAQGPLRNLGNTMLRTYSGGLAVAIASGSTITAPLTLENAGIVTTSTDGLAVSNATASTSGVPVQISPRVRFRSNVWNTTAVAANNTDDFWIESVPVSGTTPSGLLKFGSSLNGAASSYPMTLTSGGLLSATTVTTTSGLFTGSGNTIGWSGSLAKMRSATDGIIRLFESTATTGVSLDFATSNVLKIRPPSESGYATLDALAYQRSGIVVISGTAPTVPVACTSPSVTNSNGSVAFQVDVGSSCSGISTLSLTMPTATNAWAGCKATHVTSSGTRMVEMTTSTTTSVTFTNYARTTGVAADWADGNDVRVGGCIGG